MDQNLLLQMQDQTKNQEIFAKAKHFCLIMTHAYGSAQVVPFQFKQSTTAKPMPFTNDEAGYMRLYEAVKLFGRMHITKTETECVRD
jgi:hypothetical protein